MRHVQGRQVHQLEGAELEAHLVFEDAVDGGEVSHTLAGHAQGFSPIAAPGVIDDKAGGVLCRYRGMTELAGVVHQALADRRRGFQPRNHFYHPHQRHRIEKMVTRQALRRFQGRTDGCHRQRGGVGGQHGVGRHDGLQIGEQALLDVELFNDGLDHQIAAREVGQGGGDAHTVQIPGLLLCREPAFGGQLAPGVGQGGARGVGSTWLQIEQQDLASRLGRHLSDAAAHGAGANNADSVKC